MKTTCLSILFSILGFAGFTQTIPPDSLYFGQQPPDTIPKIFAPGIICLDNRFEGTGAFSPDGRMLIFTVTNGTFSSQKLFCSEYLDNKWTTPDTVSFSKVFNNLEPFFSYDGQKLFFSSDRDKKTKENRRDLYFVNKLKNGWSAPVKLDPPLNSDYTEFYFQQAKSGTVYFASNRPGGNGMIDIYYAEPGNGTYGNVKNMGSVINVTGGFSADPCIAPDESFLIFSSARTPGATSCDLFISFNEKGAWTEPVSMGNLINTTANEYGPFLSPDGKYLFFIRHDGIKGDICWVSAEIIKKVKKMVR
jgi:Tol biopolymer transport system component